MLSLKIASVLLYNPATVGYLRDFVKAHLQKGTVKVVFVKADGLLRQMVCTLDEKKIPANLLPTPPSSTQALAESAARTKTDPPEVVRVYDIESQGWRSFRLDRLLQLETVEE